ncbi:proline-rich protein 35 [Scleropages formosus]|uniref:proline-rich protein 35 n=1 Tax=Scleropages formosus TaxID=113540 RepID=UPI0008791045|nr:proline-rich protein 35 [Scleropages formosus]XP_029102381.1 proline-rich protein 35 [Scleropages formosus]XP_029102382.1 proline-rich protein 35 [Scleropages formosus]
MSKEELTCKVSSGCKHKERKPKKPHYIPRPWGKPYNYKCFQCPFTCMEKSHLYNHMKYSLCKNSLSLLIESDWPYKKGNLLHPDQLRPLQQGSRPRGPGREELELFSGAEDQARSQQPEVSLMDEEAEDAEERGDAGAGRRDAAEENAQSREASEQTDSSTRGATKKSKRSETDFVITDVFSLEDQLLRARSIEVEAKLKHYKLSKTCLTGPSLLSEQWRLLATSHRKAKSESTPPSNGSIPCYPPPPSFADCPDPPGLNLSVLGVSYPLSPGLFSYVNPAVPGTAPSHTPMGQLPFLASAAQFMHPASNSLPHTDRSLLPPRFYYPLLCEHAFGTAQGDTSKGVKTGQAPAAALDSSPPSSFIPKINLWKVPALRPSPWTSHQHAAASPDVGYRTAEEKAQAGSKDKVWSIKAAVEAPHVREHGSKRTGAPLESHDGPVEKKIAPGFPLDLLKSIHITPAVSIPTEKLLHHSGKGLSENLLEETSAAQKPEKTTGVGAHDLLGGRMEEQSPESAAALLADLSKALQEYQEAERKISHLAKEDNPGQRHLWDHLCKIRSELSHIHRALEKTARQNEGPLDLSIKKDLGVAGDGERQCAEEALKGDVTAEAEEEEEVEEEEADMEGKTESLESEKQSLGVFIKMSSTGLTETASRAVVKTEVLSPGALGLRAAPVEALWPSRTTKCEADSSVLLCPDGRPLVFTDFPPGPKSLKRPSSGEHLGETLCPLSPLASNDP